MCIDRADRREGNARPYAEDAVSHGERSRYWLSGDDLAIAQGHRGAQRAARRREQQVRDRVAVRQMESAHSGPHDGVFRGLPRHGDGHTGSGGGNPNEPSGGAPVGVGGEGDCDPADQDEPVHEVQDVVGVGEVVVETERVAGGVGKTAPISKSDNSNTLAAMIQTGGVDVARSSRVIDQTGESTMPAWSQCASRWRGSWQQHI